MHNGATVRQMLKKVGVVITRLTGQRRTLSVSKTGEMKGIRLCSLFDDETRNFITLYFPGEVRN